jgi:hypothetical protein
MEAMFLFHVIFARFVVCEKPILTLDFLSNFPDFTLHGLSQFVTPRKYYTKYDMKYFCFI